MRRLRSALSLTALAALLSSGIACKQGAGDRCELDSDCKSGLVCNGGFGHTDPMGGICGPPPTAVGNDASVPQTEGGVDMALETAGNDTTGTDGGGDAGDGATGGDTASGGDAADDSGSDATADSAAD